jgi:hypothetical protein
MMGLQHCILLPHGTFVLAVVANSHISITSSAVWNIGPILATHFLPSQTDPLSLAKLSTAPRKSGNSRKRRSRRPPRGLHSGSEREVVGEC